MRTVTVVGASLAGFSAARALRAQGFDGRLVITGAEHHTPYDRPPLSKEYLTTDSTFDDISLVDQEDLDEIDAEWLMGRSAVAVHPARRSVELADGREITTDGLVAATGASPRVPQGFDGVAGVHTLRTAEDAATLRAELAGNPRVVVVGAGFIGAEVASSCVSLGLDVTVVEAAPMPLVPALGEPMARVCSELHAEHGTRLLCGTGVDSLLSGGGRVTGLRLSDGRELAADVVVLGIGVRPNTGWLTNSGVGLGDGVLCDSGCVTSLPNIVATGDVARLYHPETGRSVRAEHWTSATQQPTTAVRNLLAGRTVEEFGALPYFWSDQYGVRIQFAGTISPDDEVRVVEGSIDDRSFLASYEREGERVGVLGFNRSRDFGRARRALAKPGLAVAGG